MRVCKYTYIIIILLLYVYIYIYCVCVLCMYMYVYANLMFSAQQACIYLIQNIAKVILWNIFTI